MSWAILGVISVFTLSITQWEVKLSFAQIVCAARCHILELCICVYIDRGPGIHHIMETFNRAA